MEKEPVLLSTISDPSRSFHADHLEIIPIALRRMGNINMITLRRMHQKKIVDGLNLTDVTQVQKTPPICSGWAKGKIHRSVIFWWEKKNASSEN